MDRFCEFCGKELVNGRCDCEAFLREYPMQQTPAPAPSQYQQQMQSQAQYQQSSQGQQYQQSAQGQQYQQQGNPYASYNNGQLVVDTNAIRDGITDVYKNTLRVFLTKPFLLFGLYLVSVLTSLVASFLGAPFPVFGLWVTYNFKIGMPALYLNAIRGEEISEKPLFASFHAGHSIRNALSVFISDMWLLIWTLPAIATVIITIIGAGASFIPGIYRLFEDVFERDYGRMDKTLPYVIVVILLMSIVFLAALVFCINRHYAYRFIPYIVYENPEITEADAISQSKKLTSGIKLKMFLAEFFAGLCWTIVSIFAGVIFGLFLKTMQPLLFSIGIILQCLLFIANIFYAKLFVGILRASFYDSTVKNLKR